MVTILILKIDVAQTQPIIITTLVFFSYNTGITDIFTFLNYMVFNYISVLPLTTGQQESIKDVKSIFFSP